MLPTHLISTYRQYKQDTDSVASWLASTAKSCGYPADLLTSPTTKSSAQHAPKSGRLKGKARAKARANGAAATNPKTEHVEKKIPKYTIAIRDFLPLADYIAGRHNPPISVPEVFSTTIDRLITLRSGFSERLSASGIETDARSDQKHGYFVGVLEAVRKVLKPGMTDAAKTSTGDVTQSLGGKFAALSVEEPSSAFIEAFRNASEDRPKPRDDDPISYEAEPQTSLEDVMFAFIALADDLKRIRSRIKWIWSNHRNGTFDIAIAAVSTNTAITLARGLIEELAPLLEAQDNGVWGVLNKFYLMVCIQRGLTLDQLFTSNAKDNFNYDTYDVADECYFVAVRLLTSFVDVLEPNELPLYKEGMFGRYRPESDRASKTGKEKFLEDQILLMEFFTELITVIRVVPDYPVEDEFLREMRVLEKTSSVSLSLVFAAQVYLDIHHVLREQAREGFMAMTKESKIMSSNLERHLEFHKTLKIQNWPSSNDQMLQQLHTIIQWMGQDPVHTAKAKAFTRMGMPVPMDMERHRVLLHSPVLTGLYLFRLRSEMYEIGIAVANAWGSITYPAHLYNAMSNEDLLEGQWADMDVLLTILGDSNIWVGGERPKTSTDCFQKFCLQMGVSAAAFTQNRRRNTAVASRAGPRGIKEGVPVSSMFRNPITTKSDMRWTPELLDDIIARSAFESDGSVENGNLVMTQIDDTAELRDKERLRQQKAKNRASGKDKTVHQLDPEKLVETLVLALNNESLELAFPWLLVHRWFWGILKKVKESCDADLRARYTFAYMGKESELPWVIGYILMAAGGVGGAPDKKLLQLAAQTLNQVIGSGAGEMALKVAGMYDKNVEIRSE